MMNFGTVHNPTILPIRWYWADEQPLLGIPTVLNSDYFDSSPPYHLLFIGPVRDAKKSWSNGVPPPEITPFSGSPEQWQGGSSYDPQIECEDECIPCDNDIRQVYFWCSMTREEITEDNILVDIDIDGDIITHELDWSPDYNGSLLVWWIITPNNDTVIDLWEEQAGIRVDSRLWDIAGKTVRTRFRLASGPWVGGGSIGMSGWRWCDCDSTEVAQTEEYLLEFDLPTEWFEWPTME